ncbi:MULTISPECIES: hypothetical protein [unclassified Alistipes]|jgi:hypothetical protein|uniref:hypothetical protein n=1 Tax=unclassified Alistipes TaxID=2608932 RepID=UPI001D36AF08|nr:hypothetical protein [uncultured Alistipes sp.]MBD9136416.1 hypothetical protein [Alistipes shahii]
MTAKLLLILRFYRSAMLFFCGAVSLALAWVAKVHGAPIVPALLLGKALIYPLFLYVWIVPRYSDEFYYYRNLGIRRRALLGISCAVDFGLCCLLLNGSAALLYAAR